VVTDRRENGIGELIFLGLGFLDAHNVGALFLEPVKEALSSCGTYAVGITGNDAGHAASGYKAAQCSQSWQPGSNTRFSAVEI
jgi:hypothetical protein